MQHRIEEYKFGKIVIAGKAYSSDLIITPRGVLSPWWRGEGHLLKLKDFGELKNSDIEYVVIGTGYNGMMEVLEEVTDYFKAKGVKVYIADTRKAVELYNILVEEGRRVLGAFHLTC
ncbi:MAG: Mth938-like domain-containing protein [Thermofilaceae archaeon]